MTNDEFIEEVGEWAIENFGTEQPPAFPLIGAGEEAGELTRSVLKRAQGIDDSEKYDERDDVGPEAERDAIGDIAIYAADMLYRLKNDIGDDEHADNVVFHLLGFYADFGLACETAFVGADGEVVSGHLKNSLCHLDKLAEERGYDFDECVAEAWEEVSGRTWDADISGT